MPSDIETYQRLEALLYTIKRRVEASDRLADVVDALACDGYDEAALRRILRPPVEADLHSHSNYSDGNLPPRKIVWLAKLFGLTAVAVTDHDSVSGVNEALQEGDALGLTVVPGLEFGTGRSGVEILTYFPNAGHFSGFLAAPAAQPFLDHLAEIQRQVHEDTIRVIDDVNAFLASHGVGQDDPLTVDELGEWFGGQQPYYPGTTAVLGLKRLPPELRDALGIHDPREFNTQVVSPAMKRIKQSRGGSPSDGLEQVFEQVEYLRDRGIQCVTALAHPRELETKGKMPRGDVEPFVANLCGRFGLDGIEVNNSRDTAADSAHWRTIADRIDARGCARHPLIRFCFSSDFHVLAPGLATGEITLGYGMLDEGPAHRAGNLEACMPFEELLRQMRASMQPCCA